MAYFHLRYDYKSADHLERFIDFVRRIDCSDRLIVLEKKTTNQKEHLHCIFTHRRLETTVRQQFMKKFPDTDGKGGKEYELHEIKSDTKKEVHRTFEEALYDAEKYLCKGDIITREQPNIVLQTGKYSVEFIVKAHTDYWLMNDFLNKNKKPTANAGPIDQYIVTHRIEKVVKPKKNFYNDVIQFLFLQYPEREWNIRDTPLMFHAIMKMHGKNFRPYGPQQIENEMNVIMNILVFESHYTDMYEQIARRGNIPHITTQFN